ncbi:phosphatase PAP2 family protein [Tepidibacter hydrothermalis]|uniref:Phosphatase PAP2 family protein n=1 Tax=Tepidibacter hydrothermalis TaxID=3036126 RepID=A0ABY8EF93_9FIRM|nr:phosphatase PAP2 family protein [Tepidibacter hydrothermalis]WFD09403.1 phosphatase PAP2 family protein [Tepidibacter hydrothermalis]
MLETIQNIDLEILNFIQEVVSNTVLDKLMIFMTMLGNKGIIWIVISLLLLINKKTRRVGIMAMSALILTAVLGEGLIKPLLKRARPFIDHPSFNLIIKPPSSYSFPSGHTASSFAVAGVLIRELKKYGIVFLVLATLIAFSRLYLFVHYPSDIVAGIIMGLMCAWITNKVFNRKEKF